jgi:hypothetical protein
VPLALAAGVVAVAPAAAQKPAPAAHAAGGDVVAMTYPSIVNTRVGRTNRALRRAVKQIENNDPASAATLKAVRRQMAAAWRGAKYIIRTTPPPPVAGDASVHAHKSSFSNLVLGATPASPADTGVRVPLLQASRRRNDDPARRRRARHWPERAQHDAELHAQPA